jgi:hypothetical protein
LLIELFAVTAEGIRLPVIEEIALLVHRDVVQCDVEKNTL